MKIQQETENCAFYSSIYSCTDFTTKTFDQWIKKHTLIFYFSISTCQPCLESICDEVKLIFPDYTQREDIVFFSNDLEYRLRNNFLGKKIAMPANKDKDLPFEKFNLPIFFVLDKENIIQHVFVADKENTELLKTYLKIIQQKYFQ